MVPWEVTRVSNGGEELIDSRYSYSKSAPSDFVNVKYSERFFVSGSQLDLILSPVVV